MRAGSCMQARPALAEQAPPLPASGILATATSILSTLTGAPSLGRSLSRDATGTSLHRQALRGTASRDFMDEAGMVEEDALDPGAALPRPVVPNLAVLAWCLL